MLKIITKQGCLRVLLIRKEFKLKMQNYGLYQGLRVLLIRKEFKRIMGIIGIFARLRVLLIRKEFKRKCDCRVM